MIRATIVADERRARAYLSKLVVVHADVVVVGEARDGRSALEACRGRSAGRMAGHAGGPSARHGISFPPFVIARDSGRRAAVAVSLT